MLEGLVAADLFVVPLDERGHWYRYHHLFGAFLRARLASLGTSRMRSAHDRASRCLEERGDVEGALRHAMAIGDVERAGWILRAALDRSLSLSEGAGVAVQAVRLWLHEFGATFVTTEPAWVVEFVTGLITLAGRTTLRGGWSGSAGPIPMPTACSPPSSRAHGASITSTAGSQWRRSATCVWRWMPSGVPSNRGLLPLLYAGTARAYLQAGELDEAGAVLERALAHPVGNPLTDEVRLPGIAAYVAAGVGRASAAEALARSVAQSADSSTSEPRSGADLRRIGLGRAAPRTR